jgi:hypothetical protein
MWYRLKVRLTRADTGKRVVIRWRPGLADSKQMTGVLGILEQADAGSFTVRTRDGKLVVIPAGRALAGKRCHHCPPADATPAPGLPDRVLGAGPGRRRDRPLAGCTGRTRMECRRRRGFPLAPGRRSVLLQAAGRAEAPARPYQARIIAEPLREGGAGCDLRPRGSRVAPAGIPTYFGRCGR